MIELTIHDLNLLAIRPVRSKRHLKEKRLSSAEPSPARKPPDLNQTLSAVAAGDRQAFARLYDELSPAAFGLIRRIVRSRAHAEEVTQEVFFEVWRKASDWKPHRGNATSWVLMIARARATDRVRSEQASRDRQERVAPGWVERPDDDVAELVAIKQEHEDVRSSLSALTDKQRQVIELAYYGDKTYSEIADSLGLPVSTVKTRMRDGLMRMRDLYGVSR